MTGPSPQARRARTALAGLFFVNGAVFANVVPRYPDIKAGLDLSNSAFGAALGGYGLGALVSGVLAGWLVRRYSSARVAPASTVLLAAGLVLLGTAPGWWVLAAALFLAGACDSVADIAVNAHGLRVERRYGRSILNAFHGLWSVGAVTGGAMGAAAAGLGIPVRLHLSAAAAFFALVAVLLHRFLLPGADGADRRQSGRADRAPRRRRVLPTVAALGAIAGCAQLIEEVGASWSAVYLRQDLAVGAAAAGLGFIALQTAQTVGRLLGDRFVTRFGDRVVARAGAAVVALPMVVALAVPSPVATVVAFGAAGLGIGTLIPASLRTVDELPGLSPGTGLTLVGLVLRVSLFVVPPVIGLVADAAGLRVALLIVPLAAAVVALFSSALPVSRR